MSLLSSAELNGWFDAQKVAPENMQFCVVIGETKTTNTTSPYLTMYLEKSDEFQHLGRHKIYVPRKKARWWLPIEMPHVMHPMDKD